jgi:hypothetical protein
MTFRVGGKYRHLVHGATCACHGAPARRLFSRVEAGLSRRSVLKGIAAAFAAPTLASAAFAQQPAKPLLLTNAAIFDGVGSALVAGQGVLVEGGLVKALVPAGDTVADADVVDCGGRTVMPGMIDAHWHALLAGISQIAAMTADIPYVHLVAAQEAERTVLRGFTTVRDVGGPAFALKRAIDEGRVAGPRIYPSGAMISQTSGHGDFRMRTDLPRTPQSDFSVAERAGIASIADGEAEVLRSVREQLMLGASQIKIHGGGGVSSSTIPSTRSNTRKPRCGRRSPRPPTGEPMSACTPTRLPPSTGLSIAASGRSSTDSSPTRTPPGIWPMRGHGGASSPSWPTRTPT